MDIKAGTYTTTSPTPRRPTAFESLMAIVRGLELTRIMRTDTATEQRVLEDWLERVTLLRMRSPDPPRSTGRDW